MNPFWDEMFQIAKKVGPACWGIVNYSTGKSKIVHHDQLEPAGTKQDASVVLKSGPEGEAERQPGRILIRNDHGIQLQNLPVIDREQFSQ